MAIGQLSSLGLGSGALNYDVIEKLKKSDERSQVAPVENKIKENLERQKELVEVDALLGALKSPVSSLADDTTYQARKSSVSNDSILASVSPGVPVQEIKIGVESIAKNDVNEVGIKFSSPDDVFSNAGTRLRFYSNGNFYTINIPAGMTLEQVAQEITDKTNGEVMGIVMKAGGEKPYGLMINSKDTGEGRRIYFGSTITLDPLSELKALNEGDLNLVIKDKAGAEQTISILMPEGEEQNQNPTETLRDAIYKTLSENENYKDLLDGEINIGLSEDHRTLILNDKRGYPISLNGKKLAELGLSDKQSVQENFLNTKKPIPSGHLKGQLMIGGQPLDLDKATKDDNSSEDNARIIAKAVENIKGVRASSNKEGRIVISSEGAEVKIEGVDEEGKRLLDSLGMQGGVFKDVKSEDFGIKNLQQASDAKLVYNGTNVIRPSNEIDDIIKGVSLTLVHPTEPEKPAMISIRHDTDVIKEEIKNFVKAYNDLVPKLNELTHYDTESKVAGIFNGVSDIRTIRPSLNSILSHSISSKDNSGSERSYSLMDYGMSLDEKSIMKLDEGALSKMIDEDPQRAVDIFYGHDPAGQQSEAGMHASGVFVELNQFLKGLIDGSQAKLNLYQDSLSRDAKALNQDKLKAQERLKSRYDAMAQRFAAYDEQIAKANNSFNSVQMMIDEMIASKRR